MADLLTSSITPKTVLAVMEPSITLTANVALSTSTATLVPGTILMHKAADPSILYPWDGAVNDLADVTTELEALLDQVDALCDANIALITQILAHTHSTDAHILDGTGQVTAIEAVDTTIDGIVTALAALKTAWTATNPTPSAATVAGVLMETLSATTDAQAANVLVFGVVKNENLLIHGGTYPTAAQWAKIKRDSGIYPFGTVMA